MKIILNKEEIEILENNAGEFNVDPDDLLKTYTDVISSNFEQDMWDIVNENWKELGGRDFEQEEYERGCL